MDFVDSIKTCFTKFADFNGRAGLPEFWWFTLFILVAPSLVGILSSNLSMISSFILMIPYVAVTARRLHDIDKSGWTQLSYNIAATVGLVLMFYGFISVFFPNGSSGGGSMLLGYLGILIMLASIAYAIYLLVKPGSIGGNQYGEPSIH